MVDSESISWTWTLREVCGRCGDRFGLHDAATERCPGERSTTFLATGDYMGGRPNVDIY